MALRVGLLCLSTLAASAAANDEAVVFVVDPDWDCVESYAAHIPLLQKYKVVKVMTRTGQSNWCNADRAEIYKNITYNSVTPSDSLALKEICPQLKTLGLPIAAIIPTFDTTVYLTDLLAACVGVRGNPSVGPLAKTRRDKAAMSDAVRKAGLRAVHEKLVSTWDEASEYLQSLSPPLSKDNPVVYKILQGSSSRGVEFVHNMKEAKEIFDREVGTTSYYGDKIGAILIQECLKGKEYVIDSASRDGVHKVVMVYNEELRPANGVFDLYFGFKVMDPEDWKTKAIMEYANGVLTATGLQNGAADMEVFWLEDEGTPCVVDLNARWTGLMWHDGLALEKALTGHDQITATINAYLDANAFDEMPAVPVLKEQGALVFMNSFQEGIVKDIPGMAVAKKLPSYIGSYDKGAFIGQPIPKTTSHCPITILLANRDMSVVNADYDYLLDMTRKETFFDIVPPQDYASLTVLRRGNPVLPGRRLSAAVFFVGVLAVSAALVGVAMSRRYVSESTDYITIE